MEFITGTCEGKIQRTSQKRPRIKKGQASVTYYSRSSYKIQFNNQESELLRKYEYAQFYAIKGTNIFLLEFTNEPDMTPGHDIFNVLVGDNGNVQVNGSALIMTLCKQIGLCEGAIHRVTIGQNRSTTSNSVVYEIQKIPQAPIFKLDDDD